MATLDTGTSLMLVSQTTSDAINSAIPGAVKDVRVYLCLVPSCLSFFIPCREVFLCSLTNVNYAPFSPCTFFFGNF
jgi:hypothetical protein